MAHTLPGAKQLFSRLEATLNTLNLKMTSMDHLPNEILDVIFGYVVPVIDDLPITPIYRVCNRWNRPMMTRHISSSRLPRIDLQSQFPNLTALTLLSSFQGHAFLKKLSWKRPKELSPVLNCPRLIWLVLTDYLKPFFNAHLAVLLTLSRLTRLELTITRQSGGKTRKYNQKLVGMLQKSGLDTFVNLRYFTLNVDRIDLVPLCTLFQAPRLFHFQTNRRFNSTQEVVACLALFPMIRSVALYVENRLNLVHDRVTNLEITKSHEVVRLSSVMDQFPKIVSLDTHLVKVEFDVLAPTQIRYLKVGSSSITEPRLFPYLQKLEWPVPLMIHFNRVLQQLSQHCPSLINITLFKADIVKQKHIDTNLDGIHFPRLIVFWVSGYFAFDSSFIGFIERHPKLVTLIIYNLYPTIKGMDISSSEVIIWPNLTLLRLDCIYRESVTPSLHWILKNAPKLTAFDHDMGDFEPTKTEGQIAVAYPNLQAFRYTGHVSRESWIIWTRGGWKRSMTKLFLSIKFDPVDLPLFLQFLKSLSRLEYLGLSIPGPHSCNSNFETFKQQYYESCLLSCPTEWKSLVTGYCDALYGSIDWGRTSGREAASTLMTVIRKVLSNPSVKIELDFHPRPFVEYIFC